MNNIEPEIIVRYIKDECSAEEKANFELWLSVSDRNKETYADILFIWEKIGDITTADIPVAETTELWNNIEKSISSSLNTEKPEINPSIVRLNEYKSSTSQSNKFKSWFPRVAAVIIVMLGVYFITQQANSNTDPTEIIIDNKPESFTRSTAKGEKAIIPLCDGSTIYLNVNSKLKYPRKFAADERLIELEGEAFFVVAKDSKRPFRVISNNMVTEVVGTEFNIKSRNNNVELVVVEGKVNTYKVDNADDKISLTKGKKVNYSVSKGFGKTLNVNSENYALWRKNKLAFNDTPLNIVMQEIEMCFNVKPKFNNKKLLKRKLTGVFQADSLDEILSAISMTMGIDIDRKGKIIILE